MIEFGFIWLVTVFTFVKQKLERAVRSPTFPIRRVSWYVEATDKVRFSGSADQTIKIWDLESGDELQSLNVQQSSVYSLIVKDGMLISGFDDGKIKILDFTFPSLKPPMGSQPD
ncbi:MAG: hypothetical protein JSR93_07335 [Verrucomicrobia bacterium]|nr:hypothetical protein [Verrucomicrobiota bacterium]